MTGRRRTAIVTGAGSGLGRALAVRLAGDGWEIALCDIDVAAAEETLALVEGAGGAGRVETLDVGRPEEWDALRERLARDWPRLDLLVNNAGVAVSGEVGCCPLEDWRWIVDANLWGTIHGCHACIDWLKANPDRPHIVNVASLAAIGAAPAMAAYNVTKAGIVALSETLWTELRPHGVGVTVLCPSFFHRGRGRRPLDPLGGTGGRRGCACGRDAAALRVPAGPGTAAVVVQTTFSPRLPRRRGR